MQGPCAPNVFNAGYVYIAKAAIPCYGYDSLVQFDLAPLAGVAATRITGARLELYKQGASANIGAWQDFQAAAYPNRGTWTEATNWNAAPSFDSSAAYENRIAIKQAVNVWTSWNVTRAVQDWAGGTQPNLGLRLVAIDGGQNADLITYYPSRESTDTTFRPRLVVDVQSAPAANGTTCTADGDCASGFCTSGLCCNSRCSDQACGRCDLPGKAGTCSPTVAGTAPPTSCGGVYLCNGQATGCPSTCVATSCAASYTCLSSPMQYATSTYIAGDLPSSYRRGAALADLNVDGKLDLIVSDNPTGFVRMYAGNGNGSFAAGIPVTQLYSVLRSVIGDFNGDGRPDVAVADYYDVSIVLNTPTGFAAPISYFLVNSSFNDLVAADFNGDGKLDVAAVQTTSNKIQLFLGQGDGTLAVSTLVAVGASPATIAAGDFNGDGRPDLAVTNSTASGSATVTVAMNAGGAAFTTSAIGTRTAAGVALGDFDADGKLDLVTTDAGTALFTLFRGRGDGTFQTGVDIATHGGTARAIAVRDLDGDGKLDVAVGFDSAVGWISLHAGNGDGTFAAPVDIASYGYPQQIAIGDINGDSRPDVVAADYYAENAVNGNGVVSVTLNQTPGGTCKRATGGTCGAPGECATGFCADGVCCNAACSGGCDVCSAALGATANGVCTLRPAGQTGGSPSCGPYLCGGGPVCPSSCATNANCTGLRWCSGGQCVPDTQAPALVLPAPVTIEATGPSGAVASYPAATASDNRDGPVAATCAPPSGGTFALGATPVTCSAGDANGNQATGAFQVLVRDTTPPVIGSTPPSQVLEATSPAGSFAAWASPLAQDLVSGVVPVTCVPPSGSLFPVDLTSAVTCHANDGAGNLALVTFSVTVRDTSPPSLTLPSGPTLEAGGPAGAPVAFGAAATDLVDGAVIVQCSPASGSTLPVGATVVSCNATDVHGNTSAGTFTATVVDTTPPVLASPANVTAAATSAAGATVAFAPPTALDLVDGPTTVTCAPASGSPFLLGVSTVTCATQDAAGNAATGTFTVTVRDLTPPALTLPDSFAVEATSAAGATVTYSAMATDVIDGLTSVTCTPASGSKLALGATTVSCSSTDAAGNTATDSFVVTVQDTTAPVVALDPQNTLPGTTRFVNVLVSATATDGATGITSASFIVSNGGAPRTFGPFTPDAQGRVSATLSLAEGANQIVLNALDRAGNSDATPARTIVLDTVAPVVTILAPADGDATGTANVQLSFSLVDRTPTTVTVAGQTFTFPTGLVSAQAVAVGGLAQGLNTLVATAQDAAGNVGSAQVQVLVDGAAPALAIATANGAAFGPLPGNQLPFKLTVTSLGATTVTSSFGATFALPRGGGVVQGLVALVPGTNTFSFTAVNEVGHDAQLGRSVTYDPTAPTGAFVSPAAGAVVRGTVQLSADVVDAFTGVASVAFRVDAQAPLTATNGAGPTWVGAQSLNTTLLADGPHALAATLVDGVGNQAVITESFRVDNTAPVVSITSPAAGAVLRGTVPITATAVDGVSGLASVSIKVNGASAGSCAVSPCTIAYDTTLLLDGPLTISVTAKDLAGNASPATQITATSSNALPANFVISPTNGQVLTTSTKVTVKVLDSRFAKVECFVDGVSLGASTNPNFTTTVSLVNKIDGELIVTCKAQDSTGNVGTQTVTPTVKNWLQRVRPQAFNLKSKGTYVRMVVRNTDRQVQNASNLIPISGKNLTLQIPGVSPIPVIASTPTGTKDDDSDGDGEDDPDDKDYRRVVLKVSRPTFIASVKAGIAVGSIDPKKPMSVKLYSGTHYIGSDTMDVKP